MFSCLRRVWKFSASAAAAAAATTIKDFSLMSGQGQSLGERWLKGI